MTIIIYLVYTSIHYSSTLWRRFPYQLLQPYTTIDAPKGEFYQLSSLQACSRGNHYGIHHKTNAHKSKSFLAMGNLIRKHYKLAYLQVKPTQKCQQETNKGELHCRWNTALSFCSSQTAINKLHNIFLWKSFRTATHVWQQVQQIWWRLIFLLPLDTVHLHS